MDCDKRWGPVTKEDSKRQRELDRKISCQQVSLKSSLRSPTLLHEYIPSGEVGEMVLKQQKNKIPLSV